MCKCGQPRGLGILLESQWLIELIVPRGKNMIILKLFLRNHFLPIGKWQSQMEALSRGSYLVIIAVREELLPRCVFEKTSLRGECKLRKEVGSRGLLCCGLKGKVTWLQIRPRKDPLTDSPWSRVIPRAPTC